MTSGYKAGIILALQLMLLLNICSVAQLPVINRIRVPLPGGEPVFTRGIQDDQGYLWLGSGQGLFRFDGNDFRQFFPPADTPGFHISALHLSNDGIIWAGCRDGSIYYFNDEKITLFNPEEGTAGVAISDIITDSNGTLWWATAGEGIYYYHGNRVFNINHEDGLRDDYIYDLECDRDGWVWAGTDAGLVKCRIENGQKIVRVLYDDLALPDIIVRVIKEAPDGKLWLGFMEGGTGLLETVSNEFEQVSASGSWTYGSVNDLIVTPAGSWIASANGSLLEIENSNGSGRLHMLAEDGMHFGKIFDLLPDREGNIWILAGNGLYCSSGDRIRVMDQAGSLPLHNIHAIRNDIHDAGKIWFSSDQGTFLLDIQNLSTREYLTNFRVPDLKVMCLYQDDHGYLWAGTFNYGVFRIRPDDGSWIQITREQGLVNDNVLAISGHNDTLWMATLGGASEVILSGGTLGKNYKITSHNLETGLVNNFIYSVYEDKHDQIWFGTDGDGISVKTKSGWISYNEKNGLEDDVIYSIAGDDYDNIWIATASKGIFKFNDGKFTKFAIGEGLSSLDITALSVVDDEVLVVNDNGLDIIHIPTGQVMHYGEETGLAGISPDLNVLSSDRNGNIWIGTRKGIIRYSNGSDSTVYGPRTVLEDIMVYLEPIEMKENLLLGYGENHVSFRYAGLWFSNPEKVICQVFLEGYDLGWKDTYDRQVTYSSLPPGKYTFRVRSSIDQSFRNASETGIQFRIRGPFWLSAWFIGLFILIVVISGLLIVRYRERRLRKIEAAKKEKVEFEFQVLKNQVNPHFLFNSFSTLISLIEDNPEQAVEYTEKLSDFFRTILQFKDEEVITLDEELSLIESYFFLLKKRYNDNLNLSISLDEKLKKSLIPPMTLQILIENAVKHNIISKDKPLFIKVYDDNEKIVVENNLQPKLTAEKSTGIGLENIRKRYRLITKSAIEINMSENLFKIILPILNQNHL